MADSGNQPLCTRVRIVRQLQSVTYREHIRATTTNAAFVVGDPLVTPPFQQLPGARREAEEVAAQLERGEFKPTFLPAGATALEVLGGLLARPYRILHLAGHGDYRRGGIANSHERSGMVLDSGAFLTAAEVRKMAQVGLPHDNARHHPRGGRLPIPALQDHAQGLLGGSTIRQPDRRRHVDLFRLDDAVRRLENDNVGDGEGRDRPLFERFEDDGRDLLERGAVAEARGVEELVEEHLLRSVPDAGRPSTRRSADIEDFRMKILDWNSTTNLQSQSHLQSSIFPGSAASSSFSTSRATETTLSSASMSMSRTPCVARPMARRLSVCMRMIIPCCVITSTSSPS